MKKITTLATAITLTVGLTLAAPLAATANSTSTVDYAEFDAARLGHTTTQIQKNFDSAGTTLYQGTYIISKKYRQAYGDQGADVYVDYMKSAGVWKVSNKTAFWGWNPNPAHNPSTKSEYLAIKAGMTIPQVRAVIGSNGTRAYDNVSKYGSKRDIVWPTSTSTWGDVTVEFTVKNGTYVVTSKTAYWG